MTMKKTTLTAWLAALVLVTITTAPRAQFITGERLIQFCDGTYRDEANANPTFYTVCLSYLSAIADATTTLTEAKAMQPQICFPAGVENEQLRRAFVRQMHERPEGWHLAASAQALDAFRHHWPCG